jgi:hypothetical protein
LFRASRIVDERTSAFHPLRTLTSTRWWMEADGVTIGAVSNTVILGIVIPSTDPVFLGIVGVHILLGLGCVMSGLTAMLLSKGRGRHSTSGIIYYWLMSGSFVTMSTLSFMRWSEDYVLFLLGVLAFALVNLGRFALAWGFSLRVHATSMASSYVVLLTAFYVDNGRNLPIWRDLPTIAYWLAPTLIGAPILLWVLARHPLLQKRSARSFE